MKAFLRSRQQEAFPMLRDCHLALNSNPAAWPMGQVINKRNWQQLTTVFCPIIDPTTIHKLLVESCLNPCKASTSVSESIWFASILLIETLTEPIANPTVKRLRQRSMENEFMQRTTGRAVSGESGMSRRKPQQTRIPCWLPSPLSAKRTSHGQ